MPETRKVLLLGVDGFTHRDSDVLLRSVPWAQIGPAINIADYHDIIIICPTTHDDGPRATAYRAMFSSIAAFKHLHHGGRIFIVGDPRINLMEKKRRPRGDIEDTVFVPFLEWACLDINWNDARGDIVEMRGHGPDGLLRSYLTRIKSWNYSLRSVAWNQTLGASALLEMSPGGGGEVRPDRRGFCFNRIGEMVAFEIQYQYSPYNRPLQQWKGLYFLPSITPSADETAQIVLRDVLGVDIACPEPAWVVAFVPPRQAVVDVEIESTQTILATASAKLGDLYQDRERLREPLRLLYDKGNTLQPPVWTVLQQLGGAVERPQDEANEDGWVVKELGTELVECVLEIKGTAKPHHDEEGQKQLSRWVERGIQLRQKKYKGLFIGNSSVGSAPTDRPYPFGDQWIRNATLYGIVALRAEDLYDAFVAHDQGNFDTTAFWRALATTVGPLDLNQFIRQQELTS